MHGSNSTRNLRPTCATALVLLWAVSAPRTEANPIEPLYKIGYVIPTPYPDKDPAPVNPYNLIEGQYSASTGGGVTAGGEILTNQAILIDNGIPWGQPGHYAIIDPLPGDTATWAMTISTLGHVVGSSTTRISGSWTENWQVAPQLNHAYYFSKDTGTLALHTLNGTLGIPMGINSADQVVGESYTSDGSLHGFITRPGAAAVDLNDVIAPGSGYTLLAGLAIDNDGVIRTSGKDADGKNYYIELRPISGLDATFPSQPAQSDPPVYVDPPTPVPEPSTLVVLAFAGLGRFAQRRWSRSRSS